MWHIMTDDCHHSLINCSNIFKSKRHDSVMKIAYKSLESSLFCIVHVHLDLIIATKTIHEWNIECPTMTLINMSMLGNAKSSCGHLLLRSIKLMQWWTWQFFLLTCTILVSHIGCCIGLIKPTSTDFWISSLICTMNSSLEFLEGCSINLVSSLILSWYLTSYGCNLGISVEVQAKTSLYSFSSQEVLSLNQ